MDVTLAPDVEAIVEEQIRTGQYESREDVIAAGLVLLDGTQFEEARRRHEELQRDVQLAIDQAARGEAKPFDREAVLSRAREGFVQDRH